MVLEQIGQPPANIFSAEMFAFLETLINQVLQAAVNGDPEAMAIVTVILVGGIVGAVILYNASKVMFGLVKRLLLFFIVLAFVGAFLLNFWDKIFAPEPDPLYLILTAFGIGSAIIALFISTVQFSEKAKQARTLRQNEIQAVRERLKEKMAENTFEQQPPARIMQVPGGQPSPQPVPIPAPQQTERQQSNQQIQNTYAQTAPSEMTAAQKILLQQSKRELKDAFTSDALMTSVQDRSILTVFTYIVVSEFGVFSGVTVSAPNPMAGALLFIGFMVGAFVFIRKSYHSYILGISHLFIGTIFAIALSIILGNFWSEIAMETLLSIDYFTTSALVASVSGVALALFMGSKD